MLRCVPAGLLASLVAAQGQVRPSDYAVLTPNQLWPVEHYRVERPPTVAEHDGRVETCPSTIGLLPATVEDPHGFVTVVGRHPEARQEFSVGRRACSATRWRTVDPPYDAYWMSTGSSTGGNGLGLNERRNAYWGTERAREWNPTMGGCARLPYREGPYLSGWPLFLRWTDRMIEGGVAPLEWDPLAHGGDETHPVLAWRERQFQRIEWHLFGKRHVHRVTSWGYLPDGWLPGQALDPLLSYVASEVHLRGRMFDDCYFLDIRSGVATNLDDATTPGDDWHPPPGVRRRARWDASTTSLFISDDQGRAESRPSPVPSGYAALLFRRSSDDFTVGFAMRIFGDSQQNRRPTHLAAIQAVELHQPQTPDGAVEEDLDECAVAGLYSKSTAGRVAGWAGLHFFVFTGPFAAARSELQRLLAQGYLDAAPLRGLPTLGGVSPP